MIQLTDLIHDLLTLPDKMAKADNAVVEARTQYIWLAGGAPEGHPSLTQKETLAARGALEAADRHRENLSLRFSSVQTTIATMNQHGLSAILDDDSVCVGFDEGTPAEMDARFGSTEEQIAAQTGVSDLMRGISLDAQAMADSVKGWHAPPYDGQGAPPVPVEGG